MKNILNRLTPYILILPATILLGIFTIYPLLNQLYLSMTSYSLLSASEFVGFNNYVELFNNANFWKILYNTVLFTVISVIVTLILSVLTAVWLNRNTKINQFVRTAMFTPYIIALVSVAMVWMWVMDPQVGLLNYLLNMFGLPKLKWLESSDTAMFSIILVNIWKSLGYYMLVVLVALQGIPDSISESAELDNSSKVRTFFKITLPMISPTLFFLIIVMTINDFKVFDTISVMTGGGPANSTNMLVYYIYQNAIVFGNIGTASALSVILTIFTGLLTVLYFKTMAKKVHYQ